MGEGTFTLVRKFSKQRFCKDQAQHSITKEFQTLVVLFLGRSGGEGWMCQASDKQALVSECIADTLLQLREVWFP